MSERPPEEEPFNFYRRDTKVHELQSHRTYLRPEQEAHADVQDDRTHSVSQVRGENPWTGETADEARAHLGAVWESRDHPHGFAEEAFREESGGGDEEGASEKDQGGGKTPPTSPEQKPVEEGKDLMDRAKELDDLLSDTWM
jgi:hypothetical protein